MCRGDTAALASRIKSRINKKRAASSRAPAICCHILRLSHLCNMITASSSLPNRPPPMRWALSPAAVSRTRDHHWQRRRQWLRRHYILLLDYCHLPRRRRTSLEPISHFIPPIRQCRFIMRLKRPLSVRRPSGAPRSYVSVCLILDAPKLAYLYYHQPTIKLA